MSLKEPVAALFIFAFSLTAFLLAGNFQNGAEIFPRAIAGIMVVGSVILFVRAFLRPTANVPAEVAEGDAPEPTETARILISAGLTIIYVVLIVPVGFVTSTLIYIPVAAYALGLRNHVSIWLTTLIFTSCIYVFFEAIFHTPLPREAILHLFTGR